MSLSQVEKEIEKLQKELLDCNQERKKEIESQIKKQEEYYQHLSPYDHVYLARKSTRPNIKDYINHLFDDFIELHGDRLAKDDGSIVGGIGLFNQQPVTIIGHLKGKTLEDNLKCNFGMSSPEGYRKAMRLMKQAEKFKRPIIAFVDTPGAYPGMEAEMHGIGEGIARNLLEMSLLKVPIITIVIGEGGSGGALALSVSDRLVMLENSVYSILSPEGFASILWKDQEGKRVAEAASLMKLTAKDLYERHIIDHIIDEDLKGKAFIYAMDGASEKIVWKYPVASSIKNTIAITDDIVFAQDVLGNLYAVDCESGTLRWKTQLPVNGLPGLIEGLATDKGIVYAGTGKALSAFEARTGKLIWRNNDWNQREGTTTTLSVGSGVVIGSVQWSALYANDLKTGKKLWSASTHGLLHRGA